MSRRRRGIRLEMTSLMDVMFLVLVFFIYCIFDMAVHKGVKVDLPDADGADEKGERIVITIRADDSLQLNGMDLARDEIVARVTLVGSSGVGKSTLLNALAGEELSATQEIQEWSGKGRHTTTVRELSMLPSGAMVIDTPGVREIGIVGEEECGLAKGECSHRYRK